jgi:peptide/nickel transport system substrate-binding protein
MNISRRTFLQASSAVGLSAAFPGLSFGQAKGGLLRVALSEEPFAPAFDIHKISTLLSTRTAYLAYNGLVNIGESGEVVPDLAESWEISDPLTYVFKLRSGVTFHDGTTFDAESVKVNIERILDPETASPKRADFAMIETIEVVDPLTLRLKLSQAFAPLLANFRRSYFGVISPKALKEMMAADPFKASIGTGPFQFVSYTRGDKVVLKRFDKYWAGAAPLEGIEIRIMPEQSTQLAALQTGGIDYMMQTNPTFAAQIKNNPDLELLAAPSTITDFLAFNVTKAPFNDKRVRQAFSMAIDREGIARGVYRGYATAAHGAVPPAMKEFYSDNSDLPFQTYDPERAKALLKEADFPFDTELRFDTFTERPWGLVGDAIAAQVTALGVKLTIRKPDFNTFAKDFYGTKDYWFGNSSWTNGAVDPDGLMYKQFFTKESQNVGLASSPELDKLLTAARLEVDHAKRAELYNKANRLLIEECFVAFLVHPQLVEGMRASLRGYEFREPAAGSFDTCSFA